MPPFPLLRLPRLALCEVFKSLSIGEKIKLSLCSKKMTIQINNARLYSQKVLVCLDMTNQKIDMFSEDLSDWFQIAINLDREIDNPTMRSFSIGRCTVPMTFNIINTFWQNHQEGFLSVIRHLVKMFQCRISVEIGIHNSDSLQPMISELLILQLEFRMLTIEFDGSEDQQVLFNQISRNFGLFENLRIVSDANPHFRPVFISWSQMISIENSFWFTVEHLLACSCTTILLGGSHLGNEDLDEILGKWKTGGFLNLEFLYVESQNIGNNGTTILGMNFRDLDGKVIQTDNGSKKATINTDIQSIDISVAPFE